MRWFACLLSLAAVTAWGQTGQAADLVLGYDSGKGTSLSFEGVPLSRAHSLQIHAPGWAEGYYSSNGDIPRITRQNDRLIIEHQSRKFPFKGTETWVRTGPTTVQITLTGLWDSDKTARMEWSLGYLNLFAFYGGSCNHVSIEPEAPARRDPSSIAREVERVSIGGPLGRLTYGIEGGPTLTVIDGRRSPDSWWAREAPTFWLGVLSWEVPNRKPFELRATIELAPSDAPAEAPPLKIAANSIATTHALLPTTRPLAIIPKPRKLTWNAGRLPIDGRTRLFVMDERAERAAQVLIREARQRYGWEWSISPGIAGQYPPPGGIVFASPAKEVKLGPEAYLIDVTPQAATLSAPSPAGFFYAVQTMCQLLHVDTGGGYIPAVAIDDSPSLAFRGVHLFPGRDAMDLHRTLVERVFARYKFNHVILECQYTQWDADRKIWNKLSVPKEQIAEYVKLLRENFIEPIPLVQSLGHSGWIFANGANHDLAEDPDEPYAYSVTTPRTYEFIRAIYAEALELFKPKFFHIGHDEVNMRGRYPHREEAKKLGETKLFGIDVAKHDEQMRPRGVRLMLWGDMLLHRSESGDQSANAPSVEEAKARRAAIPKDAIIADWHYTPAKPEAYKSLKLFKEEGFTTLACPWYEPRNIYSIAAAARMYGAWGLLQTTWAGYTTRPETIDRETRQFSCYVLAGEYAWSADSPPPDELPWRADEVFAQALHPTKDIVTPVAGSYLDLGAIRSDAPGELGAPAGGVSFAPSRNAVELSGRLSAGGLAPSAEIACDLRASELAFLHSTRFPAAAGAQVASYTIHYADGASEAIPVHYARETRAWDDAQPASLAAPAPAGKSAGGGPVTLRILRWTNPHPEKAIARITFATTHGFASPLLYGITAVAP